MPKPDYDTSLARMAGNIAAGMYATQAYFNDKGNAYDGRRIAQDAVALARAIVAEVKRTEPAKWDHSTEFTVRPTPTGGTAR